MQNVLFEGLQFTVLQFELKNVAICSVTTDSHWNDKCFYTAVFFTENIIEVQGRTAKVRIPINDGLATSELGEYF